MRTPSASLVFLYGLAALLVATSGSDAKREFYPHGYDYFNGNGWRYPRKVESTTAYIETTVGTRNPTSLDARAKHDVERMRSSTSRYQKIATSTTPVVYTKISSSTSPSSMNTRRRSVTKVFSSTSPKTTTKTMTERLSTSTPTTYFATSSSTTPKKTTTKRIVVKTTPKLDSGSVEEMTTHRDATTDEPAGSRDNSRIGTYYNQISKEQMKMKTANISQNLVPLPANAGAALVKPTKYHYYPHNQHIYLLPECAIQQVCNAVYVRLNFTQPLCACPSRYRDPCSASLNSDDLHTTELVTDSSQRKALTLVKTCEPTAEMRACRLPRDWSLLALQNIRTGKSHYLVICRCPETSVLVGPMSHDQPTYASVPGIRVYGMMCVQASRHGRPLRVERDTAATPEFPWRRVPELLKAASWD